MKTAADKNLQAFSALFGDASLAAFLCEQRIGVFSTDDAATKSGLLLAEALGDVLGRLWPNLDACGPLAIPCISAAISAARSGDLPITLNEQWSPPYDMVVVIGNANVENVGPTIRIGANGWTATFGASATLGDSPIPVGPAAAAALAGAEVFKQVFAAHLAAFGSASLGDGQWNLWTLGAGENLPSSNQIYFPRTHVLGCGAVTHGFAWILERWPGHVSGSEVILIDHDRYDSSNGQRYAGMLSDNIGRYKVEDLCARLKSAQPDLSVKPYAVGMSEYFEKCESFPDLRLAIVGLDSAESRRHAALKLPKRSINMWTDGHSLGSSRHGLGDGWPCLFCSYPETLVGQIEEAAIIAHQVGLPVPRVRALLNDGAPLTPDEANLVAGRIGRSTNDIAGSPLRTILQQICATGHVQLPNGKANTDVPFAFSSMLAGIVGFRNLIRELQLPNELPTRWTYDVLQRPSPGWLQSTNPRANCFLCRSSVTGASGAG